MKNGHIWILLLHPQKRDPRYRDLLERIYALGWARRLEGSRIVQFSAPGLHAFEAAFGRVG